MLFFGAIWLEWNRWIVASSVALLLSATAWVCMKHNPFTTTASAIPFAIASGVTLTLLLGGILYETGQWRRIRSDASTHNPRTDELQHRARER